MATKRTGKKAAKKPAEKPVKTAVTRKPNRKSQPVAAPVVPPSEQGQEQEKRDTRFQPGVSGNPGGRPKRKPITDAYRAALEAVHPDDPEGRTYAEIIAERMVRQALHEVKAAREIADRVEGKAIQSVDVEHSGSIELLSKLSDEELEARLRAHGVALGLVSGSGQTNRTAGAAGGEGSPG